MDIYSVSVPVPDSILHKLMARPVGFDVSKIQTPSLISLMIMDLDSSKSLLISIVAAFTRYSF